MNDKKKEFEKTAKMLSDWQMKWIADLEELKRHTKKLPASIQNIDMKIGRRIIEITFASQRMMAIFTSLAKFRIDEEDKKDSKPKKFSILINVDGEIPKKEIIPEYDSQSSMII